MYIRKSFYHVLIAIFVMFSGCQNSFYTPEDYSSVKKVDAHIHIRSSDGTFEGIAGNDNFVLISLNVDHGDSADIRVQQDFAAASAKNYPGRVFFGPTFYFDTTGWHAEDWSKKIITQLEKDLSSPGAITVKIWKNIGMTLRDRSGKFIMADDPGLNPVIEFIMGRGLPLTGHLGEPKNCWLPLDEMTVSSDSSYFAGNPQYHMFLHPEYPSYEDQINARDNLLVKHPGLKFIGCHLGSLEWNVDSLAKRLDRFPNLAVDMSARICHLQYQSAQNRKRIRDFCIKYQDRLLYGTDTGYNGSSDPERFKSSVHETWLDDWKYFTSDDQMTSDKFRGIFRGLKLPKEVVDKIYRENAIKWYNLKIN
jgi:predicted TIM-barrel fold metal-dependent hydrolase